MDTPVIEAPAPFGCIGRLPVRLRTLHDGDNAFVRAASELIRNAYELLVEHGNHRARDICGKRLAFIANCYAHSIELVSAFVSLRFTLDLAAESHRRRIIDPRQSVAAVT